jgi:hypothetical protein
VPAFRLSGQPHLLFSSQKITKIRDVFEKKIYLEVEKARKREHFLLKLLWLL